MALPFAIIISEVCAPCGNGNLPRGNLIPLNETIEHPCDRRNWADSDHSANSDLTSGGQYQSI